MIWWSMYELRILMWPMVHTLIFTEAMSDESQKKKNDSIWSVLFRILMHFPWFLLTHNFNFLSFPHQPIWNMLECCPHTLCARPFLLLASPLFPLKHIHAAPISADVQRFFFSFLAPGGLVRSSSRLWITITICVSFRDYKTIFPFTFPAAAADARRLLRHLWHCEMERAHCSVGMRTAFD